MLLLLHLWKPQGAAHVTIPLQYRSYKMRRKGSVFLGRTNRGTGNSELIYIVHMRIQTALHVPGGSVKSFECKSLLVNTPSPTTTTRKNNHDLLLNKHGLSLKQELCSVSENGLYIPFSLRC